jgi:transcriptional regulator with XRE-family HTH domain
MDHAEARQESREGGVPAVVVTVDQIAALNLRYWRRAAGMTQEELGARLGWSAANVSAAERSWDGERDRRRFDAQTLAEMALALGVPLGAFFLPPRDDRTATRYLFTAGDRHHDMGELMAFAVTPDTDDETDVMDVYRSRYREAAGRYLEPVWAARAIGWVAGGASPQERADMAGRIRDKRDGLLETAEMLAEWAGALDRPASKP